MITGILIIFIVLFFTHHVYSQSSSLTYPIKTVRVYNPSSPGGGGDVIARIIQQELSKNLGQTFIVDNRPGAANIIATEIASKSPPDGYSLLLGTTGSFVTNPIIGFSSFFGIEGFLKLVSYPGNVPSPFMILNYIVLPNSLTC